MLGSDRFATLSFCHQAPVGKRSRRGSAKELTSHWAGPRPPNDGENRAPALLDVRSFGFMEIGVQTCPSRCRVVFSWSLSERREAVRTGPSGLNAGNVAGVGSPDTGAARGAWLRLLHDLGVGRLTDSPGAGDQGHRRNR